MAGFKDLAKRLDVHFGVDGGRFKAGVAEEFLDEAGVRSPVVEVAFQVIFWREKGWRSKY